MTFVLAEQSRTAARHARGEKSARALRSQTARIRSNIADGVADGASAIAVREELAPEIITALREAGYDVVFNGAVTETTITWGA